MSDKKGPPAISGVSVSKTFGTRKAIDEVNFSVYQGEMVALIGPSGSGKSTLLRHISGLIASDVAAGSIQVFGKTVQQNGHINRRVREVRADVGFIFQQFNLVGRLSLIKNVLVGGLARMPKWRSLIHGFTRAEKQAAMVALEAVGLADHASQRASTLSGGQQQRGAIARVMVQQAKIILADEPIASLDPESARRVMEALETLNRNKQVTVLVSLHQIQFALHYCSRTIALKDGMVVFDGPSDALKEDMLREIYGTQFTEFTMDGTEPLDDDKELF